MVMLRLSSAERLATPGFAQGAELTARDFAMSGPLRRQRGMLTDLLGPLTDPMATSADYATAARGLMGIDQQSALAVAAQGRNLAIKEAETQQLNARKTALATRADALGLADVATAARSAMSASELDDIAGDIRKLQIERLPSQTPQQRMAMARARGISPEEFRRAGLATSTDKYFDEYMSGQKADVEAWVNEAGEVKGYRILDNGKVLDPNTGNFVEPSALGLVSKAPTVQKVVDASDKYAEALAEAGVKDVIDQREKARTARQRLSVIERQLSRLEGGMPTGIAANFEVGLRRVGELIGLPYDSQVTNAETYMMDAAQLVRDQIKAFGSGTSITDADRVYTERMVGGDITQQAQALEEMLNIFRNSAIETITSYNTVIGQVKDDIGEDNMSGFQPITIPSRTNDSQGIPKPPPGFNLD
tara:strand:- start:1614 stop:2873 length:1260 start_codon:yes stop_codon:yes gene_type:complete